MGLEKEVLSRILTTKLDFALKWARKNSIWPLPMGISCCAIEMMAMAASRFDVARFGAEVLRFSPRQADCMIAAGTLVHKMAPVVKKVYEQMPEPKWVIAMGTCLCTGGMFHSYSTVRGLDQKVSNLSARIDALKQVERDLRQTIAKNQAAAKQAQQSLEKQLAAAVAAKTQAEARHKAELAAKDKQRLNDLAAKDAVIKQKDQQVAVLNQEKASLRDRLQEGQAEIHRLMRIIRELKKGPKVGELVLRQPDGKIAKVLLDEPVCYIDLGEKDHVTPGLSFSVYSRQSGIPENGKPKAKIVVVNVGPTTSECHVLQSDPNDPILEGDLIANVVFHPQRTYKFVVEGEFDLYGTGRPDPLANRTVRALIKSFGGKISDVVSVDTDFVIMGDEPPRPPKPAEDAPPVVWQTYNERLKVYDRYNKVQAMAISLGIPVLNTSRFLAFSGYVPRKRLTRPE